jgi:hypothetical protein
MFLFKRDTTYYIEYFDNKLKKKKQLYIGKTTKAAAFEYLCHLQEIFKQKLNHIQSR